MNTNIESFVDSLKPICLTVDEILTEWSGEGCFKMPMLIERLTSKLNWNEKIARSNDPIVRAYLRQHPEYFITPGAHGGIMKRSEKQKKLDIEENKRRLKEEIKKAKEEVKNAVEAKIAQQMANV